MRVAAASEISVHLEATSWTSRDARLHKAERSGHSRLLRATAETTSTRVIIQVVMPGSSARQLSTSGVDASLMNSGTSAEASQYLTSRSRALPTVPGGRWRLRGPL